MRFALTVRRITNHLLATGIVKTLYRHYSKPAHLSAQPFRMSLAEEPMAVEAPVAGGTSAAELAHLPKVDSESDSGHGLHIVADHQGTGVGDEMLEPEYVVNGVTNGKGKKRSASPGHGNNVGENHACYHIPCSRNACTDRDFGVL